MGIFRIFEWIGDNALYYLNQYGRMGIFLGQCCVQALLPPYKFRPILRQIHFIGAKSVFVILFTGAFTGMVLGLQGYYTLRQYGSEGALGSAVALSLIRELGPVLTALMVTGRAGSAMCAEIGIMRNSEQIDALECMAIDPHKYLMVPKFVAALVCLPLLTSIFDVVGIAGGRFVGVNLLGVSAGAYYQGMVHSVVWKDVSMGLVKSLCFGLLVVWISTSKGYFLHHERSGGFGAEGVSRVTTNAVVASSVAVLVMDYLITAILM
ncbi:ABC transporter permease [Dissulfurirhabdus thermomarina]|uniref:ABC transporter permease n=1 Tax=Dissulfurirhabdus thermomarina TaxID=1765737 RepID=A0A6N9TWV9_DISTH|nr:MlaE family lipid ABC transporter permease subunit [Dissulfurirhabdus thermomarina]NDY42966.1 ABC transporter permease [Dissulfurirhabdus thermomarina]NMX24320.1 ABC transporter permease [Dissulfurirhabdus thermomarina]